MFCLFLYSAEILKVLSGDISVFVNIFGILRDNSDKDWIYVFCALLCFVSKLVIIYFLVVLRCLTISFLYCCAAV